MTERKDQEVGKWEICQPASDHFSFPELGRYTRSDDWNVVFDGSFETEDQALEAISDVQRDSPNLDGWYATRQIGERYVSTIVEPAFPSKEATDD